MGVLLLALVGAILLVVSDWVSMGPRGRRRGARLLSANVKDQPLAVLEVIKGHSPDLVALQETGGWASCATLARDVGYDYWGGSDQCVLASRDSPGSYAPWPRPWPGPRQAPQQIRIHQCWVSRDVAVHDAWTVHIPSDHRALVVDFDVEPSTREP